MAPDALEHQLAAVRRRIAPAVPRHVSARTVELAAFEAIGRGELGLQTWHAAREAAEQTRRSFSTLLRRRYGARDPHGGWLSFALLAGLLCAVLAAVLATGFRIDLPRTVAVSLAVVAGTVGVIEVAVARDRPVNRALIRMHVATTIALVVAAAFQLSRDTTAPALVTAACAAASALALVALAVVRARDRAGAEEIDTAIDVALAETVPVAEAASARLHADVAARLSADEGATIVRLRTTTLAALAAEGVALASVDEAVPAGGAIIDDLVSTWVPHAMRDAWMAVTADPPQRPPQRHG